MIVSRDGTGPEVTLNLGPERALPCCSVPVQGRRDLLSPSRLTPNPLDDFSIQTDVKCSELVLPSPNLADTAD